MEIIFSPVFLWSFLSGVGRWRFKVMGNSLRKVSCPALNSWDSSPQETFFSDKIISSKKFSKNA